MLVHHVLCIPRYRVTHAKPSKHSRCRRWAGLAGVLFAIGLAAPGWGSSPAEEALASGTAAYLRGNFQEAAGRLEAAVASERTASAVRITVLTRLGSIYSMQGRYREAESVLGEAKTQAGLVYGEKHPNSGKIAVMLGNVLQEQGRYKESEAAYLQALQVLQPIYGTDHPDVAACLSGLAELAWLMGNNEESLRRFWRAYMVSTYLYGRDSSKVSDLLNQLSKVYIAKGLNHEAQALIARAVKIGDKPLQANRPWDRLDEHDLLLLLPSEREYSATRGQMQVKTRDSEHPEYARYFDHLAALYLAAGRYPESESSFKRSIAIRERAFGRTHPEIASAQTGLALNYKLRGNEQAALDLTRTAAASAAKRITSFPSSASDYAQGERRRWRPTFLQLLALLSDRPPGSGTGRDEFFAALQYANTLDSARAASEPVNLAEAQKLLRPDEGIAVYVRGTDATYLALVRRNAVDIRTGKLGAELDALSLVEPELGSLRNVFVVADRAATHRPFTTIPSVAALRALRQPNS